jgi:hypothetical protein
MYDKIIKIYPELADFNFASGVITLQDDGEGAYIKEWNHPTLARPTEQELA